MLGPVSVMPGQFRPMHGPVWAMLGLVWAMLGLVWAVLGVYSSLEAFKIKDEDSEVVAV